ncbi:MAG: sodium:proton antiporter [Gammaproteobacteria bacterium]|nr:sodium:proton antiporter [Gammaproteobacteria bacterium]MBT5685693.1 sodium:proton antiporter [Gammaproteobacteria bacterium]MBT6890985.1 sodium:proton antiporter [Gammaproteobacteria bacterium]
MSPLLALAGIGLLAAVAQWAAWRVRLPAILFLLVFGILAGPVAGLVNPDALFGDLLFPIISLSVAVILFEGALTLKLSELKEIGTTVRNLVTIGALITWVITSVIAHLAIGFDYDMAFLFGAMVVVTGPTVIVPMLRTVRPVKRVADILRWEGIIIDPIGALLAVLAFDFYMASQSSDVFIDILALFLKVIGIGVGVGIVFGFGLSHILRKHWLPEYLRSPFTLLMVFVAFALSETMLHESGLLAVTIFGMIVANQRGVDVDDILDFKESLSLLLISGLFIVLAARIDLAGFVAVGWGSILVVAGIILIARPISVFVSSIGSDLSLSEKVIVSWIGPRGIVCAAVAAIFALKLEQEGAPGANLLVPLAFLVIISTVVLQSLTSKPLAGFLGVRDPAPSGYLIIGGGRVGRMIAQTLAANGVRVVIADSDWDHISQARMDGIETYFGNPISDHADRYLDLSGIGNLISLSGRANFDVLASMHYRREFGSEHLYELPTSAEGQQHGKHRIGKRLRGKHLFGEDVTHNQVLGHLRDNWVTKETGLTLEFGLEQYLSKYADKALILFAIDPSDRLRLITDADDWQPDAGWKVISLVDDNEVG